MEENEQKTGQVLDAEKVTAAVEKVAAKVDAPFKTFASQSEYDKAIGEAIKANEANAQKKAEKSIEARQAELEQQLEQMRREAAKVAAKEVLIEKQLPIKDFELFLDKLASTDIEATKTATAEFADKVLAIAGEMSKRGAQDAMKSVNIPKGTQNDSAGASTLEQELKSLKEQWIKNPNDNELARRIFILKDRLAK